MGFLEACDEVCWKKSWRRSRGYTWCLNEVVKGAVSREKDAHKTMCQNSAEENKSVKKTAMETVSVR